MNLQIPQSANIVFTFANSDDLRKFRMLYESLKLSPHRYKVVEGKEGAQIEIVEELCADLIKSELPLTITRVYLAINLDGHDHASLFDNLCSIVCNASEFKNRDKDNSWPTWISAPEGAIKFISEKIK